MLRKIKAMEPGEWLAWIIFIGGIMVIIAKLPSGLDQMFYEQYDKPLEQQQEWEAENHG